MKKLIFLIMIVPFFSLAEEESEAPETYWSVSEDVIACTPKNILIGQTLKVKLGKGHGKELGVYSHNEEVWMFLVVGLPPKEMVSLMTPENFEKANSFEITEKTTGFRWDVKGGNEKVFSKPGMYTIYVSENLESEIGGYKCDISVKSH